jgi:hypothetical protein
LSLQLAAVKREKEKLCSDSGQERSKLGFKCSLKRRKHRKYFSTVLFAITDRFLDIMICFAKSAMQIVMLMHGNIVLVDRCYNLEINRF